LLTKNNGLNIALVEEGSICFTAFYPIFDKTLFSKKIDKDV
jgi:hypothetical protein